MQKHIITLLCAISMALSVPAMAQMQLRPDAPARYEVKRGDTLWRISGKYLYHPWLWPKLWGANRQQIHNPQLIYPGQVLTLNYINGQPHLSIDSNSIPTIKLQPRVHNLSSGNGISTVDVDFYKLFMQMPQVMTAAQIKDSPALVSGPENRMMYGAGDRVYSTQQLEPGRYLVFHLDQNVRDPDTHKHLGQLVRFNGEVATLENRDDTLHHQSNTDSSDKASTPNAQPLVVTTAISEISDGDRLIKKSDVDMTFHSMPHAPDTQIQAKVAAVLDGLTEAGPYQTIILNAGTAQGLDKGTVVSLYKTARKRIGFMKYINIPAQEVGQAMVYRTSDKLSSAIILQASTNINVGDMVMNPGKDLDNVEGKPRSSDSNN